MFYKVVVAVWDIKPPPPNTHRHKKKRGGGGGMGIFLSFLNMFNSVFWAGGVGGGVSQIKYLSKSIRTEALGLSELLQKAKRKQQEKKIEHLLSLKSSF